MKWIKVTDRLPEKSDFYYCKVDTQRVNTYKSIVYFGALGFDIENMQHFSELKESSEVVEWLEE